MIFLKKYKQSKKSKRYNQTEPADIVEELNAVSATDFTGLIPANPNENLDEQYEDLFPNSLIDE